MVFTYLGLDGSHMMIKFLPTHDIDDPLEWMVKEKFMEGMEYINHEEKGGVRVAPIPPKRLVHPI